MATQYKNLSDGVILMSVTGCKHAKNKQGAIGFISKEAYKINEGDAIVATAVNGNVKYQILTIESTQPSTTPGHEYYKAVAKRITL